MRKRVGLSVAIAVILGAFCFAALVLVQYISPFGGFHPYGDPQDPPSPLTLSARDGRLYAGIGIVMAIFVLLNLGDNHRFSFLGGLWRGAVASVGGPFAWVLFALGPGADSPWLRAGVVAMIFVFGFVVWGMLGVPIFVGIVAGLLSWLAGGLFRHRVSGSTTQHEQSLPKTAET